MSSVALGAPIVWATIRIAPSDFLPGVTYVLAAVLSLGRRVAWRSQLAPAAMRYATTQPAQFREGARLLGEHDGRSVRGRDPPVSDCQLTVTPRFSQMARSSSACQVLTGCDHL